MKISIADLPKLRNSLIAALLLIAIGGGSLLYTVERSKATRADRDSAYRSHQEFSGKLSQVRSEENEIRLKADTFGQLQARGVIGEERRLERIELLQAIKEQRRLSDLEYEFAAQRLLEAKPGDDFSIVASAMRLRVKLLHEEDLTRLLADLRSQAKALIAVRSCKLGRVDSAASGQTGSRARLLAECEIDWITLRMAAYR
jgi:hypothetical protein